MKIINEIRWWFLRTFVANNNPMVGAVIPDKYDPNEYLAGTIDKKVLREDGNYEDIVSSSEWVDLKQNQFGVETMGCTGQALLNTSRVLAKIQFGENWIKSPRFTNKTAGTGVRGNSMVAQLDNLRKYSGCVDEIDWPWTSDLNTWEKYYSSIPTAIIRKGQDWMRQYTVQYERVANDKESIRNALKFGPLYVSGFAWAFSNGYYRSWGSANHCFEAILVGIDSVGAYKIYDSYAPHVKTLAPDYQFGAIYTVVLKKNIQYNLDYISDLMKRGLQYVLLVSPFKDYVPGVYKINAQGVTQEDVLREVNDEGVKSFATKGLLTGISANDFSKMIIIE